MGEAILLSSGRRCVVRSAALPFLPHYHVLAFPSEYGSPSKREIEELLLIANRKARELGQIHYGDEECFSLIYNGSRTRRRPWLHIHILPTRNLAAKRAAFVAFYLKNLIRPILALRSGRRARTTIHGLAD